MGQLTISRSVPLYFGAGSNGHKVWAASGKSVQAVVNTLKKFGVKEKDIRIGQRSYITGLTIVIEKVDNWPLLLRTDPIEL